MIRVYEKNHRRGCYYPRKLFVVTGDDATTDLEVLSLPGIPKLFDPLTDSIASLRCATKTATVNLNGPTAWDVVCEYRAVDDEALVAIEPPAYKRLACRDPLPGEE